jgi:hypothetical protein
VDWSLTTECTTPDQETSEKRPYAPQGATGRKLKLTLVSQSIVCIYHPTAANFGLQETINRPRDDPTGGRRVWCGAGYAVYRKDYSTAATIILLAGWKAFFSERVPCANAFRMSSSNSSFTTTSCSCASITLLAGIISWSGDSRPFKLSIIFMRDNACGLFTLHKEIKDRGN